MEKIKEGVLVYTPGEKSNIEKIYDVVKDMDITHIHLFIDDLSSDTSFAFSKLYESDENIRLTIWDEESARSDVRIILTDEGYKLLQALSVEKQTIVYMMIFVFLQGGIALHPTIKYSDALIEKLKKLNKKEASIYKLGDEEIAVCGPEDSLDLLSMALERIGMKMSDHYRFKKNLEFEPKINQKCTETDVVSLF